MKAIALVLATAFTAIGGELSNPDDVIQKFVQEDRARQSLMRGYSVMSKYTLDNKSRHAEMVVRWTRLPNGIKQFEIVSESGDGAVRSHVFHKLLEAEVDASRPDQRENSRITPDNYSFQPAGEETIDGRDAYVFELEPKAQAKYLTRGRIWIDATDYAVIQIEGSPAHKVSFWTKKVDYVQTFKKNGDLWLAQTNRSVTEARMFGIANLTIEYFDYELDGLRAAR
jgi:hypothetical protein